MNRCYRLVWNRALHTVQVASEIARPRGGGEGAAGGSRLRKRPLALACAAAIVAALALQVAPSAFAEVPIKGGGGGGCVSGNGGAGGTGGYLSATQPGIGHAGSNGTNGHFGQGGAGGAGGAYGVSIFASGSDFGTTAGRAGSQGAAGTGSSISTDCGSGGGGGGGGGAGELFTGGINWSHSGTITGGAGGAGGAGADGGGAGAGGSGGGGVLLSNGDAGAGPTFTNNGTVMGGAGASGGAGGVGLEANGGANVVNAGSISGGLSGNGSTRADAVAFSGGGNTLTLENGYLFTGNVVSSSGSTNGGDTLALGGGSNGSFNLGQIGTEFPGFNNFAKTGSSTWTVLGNNNSPWTINAGTLQLGNGTTNGSIGGNITDNGALVFDSATTYGGVVSGTGSLTQAGPGIVTLIGDNTYTGGTTIAQGATLGIGTLGNGTPGNGTNGSIVGNVADYGTLAFSESSPTTYGGVVSGTGGLVQGGFGTLTLTGANTYTGGTSIFSTLQLGNGTTDGSIASNFVDDYGALVFDENSATTYGGSVFSSGSLTQDGRGAVTLTGANSYTGDTTVLHGILQVDGSTGTGTTFVNSGATLSGTGSVNGATDIAMGAFLDPGDPGRTGTLSIGGPLSMLGTLGIGINGTSSGEFSLLDVSGQATLGSSSVFNFAFGNGFSGAKGDTFQFFDASSFLNFADAENNFSCSGLMAGLSCTLGMNGAGNGLLLTLDGPSNGGGPTPVPEPGDLGMLGGGLALLGGLLVLGDRRRRGSGSDRKEGNTTARGA